MLVITSRPQCTMHGRTKHSAHDIQAQRTFPSTQLSTSSGKLTRVMAQGLLSIPGSLLNVNTFERFKAAQEQATQHLQKARFLWDTSMRKLNMIWEMRADLHMWLPQSCCC